MSESKSTPIRDLFFREPKTEFIELWEKFLNRKPRASDLTLANRNRFLVAQVDAGTPPVTVRYMDRCICTLWDRAHALGEIPEPAPTRGFHYTYLLQRKPWSDEDFAKLMNPAGQASPQRSRAPYFSNGVHRIWYWICFFRLTQELRLHRSVLRSIRFDQIDTEKRICDMTAHPFVGYAMPLSVAAIELIEKLRYPKREIILDKPGRVAGENEQYRVILNRLGVSHRPGGHSTPAKRKRRKNRKPKGRKVVK